MSHDERATPVPRISTALSGDRSQQLVAFVDPQQGIAVSIQGTQAGEKGVDTGVGGSEVTVKRVVAVADVGHSFVKADGGIFSDVQISVKARKCRGEGNWKEKILVEE